MEQNIVKQLVTKDGGVRINIIQDMSPDNPRWNTDFPLHCEDWHNRYSIMGKKERESKSGSARNLLAYLLNNYVDYRKIIDCLVQAGKAKKCTLNDKLVYDRKTKEWVLHTYGSRYDYDTRKHIEGWQDDVRFEGKKYDIDVSELLDCVCEDTIDHLAKEFLNERVKVMEYSFGYYGEIYFHNGANCQSDGIAWLERLEYLKYTGNSEDFWKQSACKDLDWTWEDLEAYGDNEVYGYKVEKRDDVKVHEEHSDGEVRDYVRTDWNETDACWGFYGEVDKVLPSILDNAGYKLEELEEAA